MKFTIVTQWVKVPPVQSLASRTVANPAGKPGNGSPEPGIARVQAAGLSPEIGIVVAIGITPQLQGKGAKADAVSGAEGSSPRCVRASAEDTSGVAERGMHSQGEPGNLGEPRVSLLGVPQEQGYRLTKNPGAGRQLPATSEPRCGTQTEEADKVSGLWGGMIPLSDVRLQRQHYSAATPTLLLAALTPYLSPYMGC
jgi:hypothetical protein